MISVLLGRRLVGYYWAMVEVITGRSKAKLKLSFSVLLKG